MTDPDLKPLPVPEAVIDLLAAGLARLLTSAAGPGPADPPPDADPEPAPGGPAATSPPPAENPRDCT